jgi:hypothetical protein
MQSGLDPHLPELNVIAALIPLFQRVVGQVGFGGGRYNQLE